MIETIKKYSIELKPKDGEWVQYTELLDYDRARAAFLILQGNPIVESMNLIETTYRLQCKTVEVYHKSTEKYKLAN